jgi:endoglycosylceramidase
MKKYILLFATFLWTCGYADCLFKIKVRNKFLIDDYGRVRLFHGVNAVAKAYPWIPNYGHTDLTNDTILNDFQDWGFNAVRLGVMW